MPTFQSNWRALCFPEDTPFKAAKLGVSLTTALKPELKVDIGNQQQVTVIQDHTDPDHLGSVAWDCAIFASKHLYSLQQIDPKLSFKGKNVLELGCGTGLLGIACAKLGAKCTLTDISTRLTKQSVCASKIEAECIDYRWGESVPKELRQKEYDFIVCADVLYDHKVHSNLLEALVTLWTPASVLLIAYKRRWAAPEKAFFESLQDQLGLTLYAYSESKEDSLFLLVGVSGSLSISVSNPIQGTGDAKVTS